MTNMATHSEVLRWLRLPFVSAVLVFLRFQQVKCYAPDIEVTCKSTVDLQSLGYDAGVLISRLPSRIPIYANVEEKCDIHISIPVGYELMLYFDWLEFLGSDVTRCESTSLELFDGSPGTYITGLQKKVCGREEDMPKDMFFVYKNFLILRVEANGVIMGSGFRIHFTRYRITIPCSRDEFMCETFGRTRCIANHLVCDDWNDCGDWVDEEQYCDRLTGGAIAGVVLAAVFFVGLFVFLVIWFCKCRNSDSGADEEKDADFMMRSEISKSSNIGTMAPFGVSSESMERQEYAPRYSKGQSGSRGRLSRSQDLSIPEHDDAPPPYVEKNRYVDDSRSDGASDVFEDSRPRSRRKSNGRARNNDDIDEEEMEPPRMRRPRSRSQEDRLNARPAEVEAVSMRPTKEEVRFVSRPDDRYAARKSGRDSPPEDDRYPRDGRYPSRRDEWEPEYDDRYPPRDDRRQSSGRDDRDRRDRRDDRDPRDRRDDRDPRDRRDDRDPRDRRDDRDPRDRRDDMEPRDRRDERDPRDRRSQRDPRDRRSFPRDPSDEDDDPSSVRDSLHPLREKRKSLQDLGTDDERRSRGGRSGDERSIPASEDEFPPPPSQWEEPPQSRRRPDTRAATPPPPRAARDDSLDSDQDEREPPRVRHSQRPTTVTPTSKAPPATAKPAPAPAPVPSPASASVTSDIAPDDPPQRRRRRRSRSREGREGGNRPSRGDEVPPVVLRDYDDEDDDPRPYKIRGASYREEAV